MKDPLAIICLLFVSSTVFAEQRIFVKETLKAHQLKGSKCISHGALGAELTIAQFKTEIVTQSAETLKKIPPRMTPYFPGQSRIDHYPDVALSYFFADIGNMKALDICKAFAADLRAALAK